MGRIVEGKPDLRHVDGEPAGWAEHRPSAGRVILAHAEVDRRREGEGPGGVPVRGTLGRIRATSPGRVRVRPR